MAFNIALSKKLPSSVIDVCRVFKHWTSLHQGVERKIAKAASVNDCSVQGLRRSVKRWYNVTRVMRCSRSRDPGKLRKTPRG